jgi:TRAP-type mannitol/chloroaromatic compound transport system substrate-binding protein
LAGGFAFAGFGLVVLRSNFLWLAAAPIPALLHRLYDRSNQDEDVLQNSYRYLLAKRAATAEFELNNASVPRNKELIAALSAANTNLYKFELDIVERIAQEKF